MGKAENTDSGINKRRLVIPKNNENETVSPPESAQEQRQPRPEYGERTEELKVLVTPYEKQYLIDIASLLNKIDINGAKILKADDLAELIRTCLTFTCSTYQMNVFPDSSLVTRLPTKDAVKEFMAFRKKYMNYPLDAQLTELKRMGIVKQKTNQQTTV